ncbi:hypothetical protein Tco_0164083 [Tanacetum coccineum]
MKRGIYTLHWPVNIRMTYVDPVSLPKDVQINPVQVVDASLVVMKSSGIESINNRSENALSKSVNETQMQMQEEKVDMGKALDARLVVIECSGTKSDKQDISSSSGNYITHVVDADIRPVNDQVLFAEVQLNAHHNVLAYEQQHFVQYESIYDTHLLEKVDSNTTPNSTNMCHMGGEIDQSAKKCQVTSPLLDPLTQPNTKNEKLHKENRHLKQCYKELYDFIKKTRVQTKVLNDSLIAQVNSKTVENADLKSQIQEKVFANVALKNKLRKLKGKIDGNNVLSKPVTPNYLPKVREYVLAKPHHVIAPGSSRNSQEESYDSNDMAHNHYLDEARKKTQKINRNSKPSVMHTTSLQNTTNDSKQKPRSNNQTSRSLPVSKSSGATSNSVLLVDHSSKLSLKVQSYRTRNNIKPVEKITNVIKPKRWISKGYRISPNKSSAVHEKPNNPRSCPRWKLTGRIFKTAGLRWIPTGKMFMDSTTKVDNEPPNGSNEDITNPCKCEQTSNVSVGTLNLTAGTSLNHKKERLDVCLLKRVIYQKPKVQGIYI